MKRTRPGPLRSDPRRSVPPAPVSVTATFPCEIIRLGDSPCTELGGNEYLLSSHEVLSSLPILCSSSASSRHPVYSCFLLYQHLPGFILLSGPLAPLSFQSLFTRTSAVLLFWLLAFCLAHSAKPKPGSPHPLPPMPWLVNAGRGLQPLVSTVVWSLSEAWRTFSIFLSSRAILYSNPCDHVPS